MVWELPQKTLHLECCYLLLQLLKVKKLFAIAYYLIHQPRG